MFCLCHMEELQIEFPPSCVKKIYSYYSDMYTNSFILSIYIYLVCQYIAWFVCLCPISVKTAESTRPTFFLVSHPLWVICTAHIHCMQI